MNRRTLALLALVLGLTGCNDLDIKTDGDKDTFRFASAVHLWVTYKDHTLPPDAEVRWTSNKQGLLGTGPDLTISSLQAGKHTIEVEVKYQGHDGKEKRKLEVVNDAPAVSIMEPAQGQKVGVGQPLTVRGSATDTEDGVIPAETLAWRDSLEGDLGTGPALTVSHLRPGVHELTLVARDRAGAEGKAKVSVEVTNQPPAVTIQEPAHEVTIPVGERLTLRGFATDPDHRVLPERVPAASLEWTSDRDGRLGIGEAIFVDSLSPGTHRIELVAKDEYGKEGRAAVRVTVHNDPPTVDIKEPSDGHYFSAREEVRFEADANDTEAPLDPNDIVWRSNRDGTIGRGYTLRTDRLSVGEHRITCAVTDKHGATTTKSVRVLITNQTPTARISSPAGGTYHFADVLEVAGRGQDPEDGDLHGDRLVWTAVRVETGRSLELGKGERVSRPVREVVDRLGFGRIEVRLVASDRDGAASQAATVAVTLENRAPEVRIGNPTAGATFTQGGVLLCSGYGQDPDRARLLENGECLWSARKVEDGTTRDLGKGTRLEVRDLVAGTWDITFTGVDPDDGALRTTATVRVVVTPAAPPTTTPTATPDSSTTTTTTTPTGGIVSAIPGQ
jgi:hypothetical protein